MIKPARLVEAAHLHRELDRFAVPTRRSPARIFGAAQQRQHNPVKLGGGIVTGKRRLTRSSVSQAAWRRASVPKSMKEKRTGFLIL